ncbi:gliding motility-associated C-terminal domain-containing protein, partial [Crocinitomicaceae bacterium]|nr:gliding motility-associated C-terminal domain-containing protein [Crocinitomicaceae bacterium]
ANNLGCISTAPVVVTVNTTPTLTVQDTTTCSPNTIDLTDATYWSTDVGTITYFESDGTTVVADETSVGAGIYILSADNGGCITTAPVVVTVNTTPTLTLADPAPVCSPATVDISTGAVSSTDVGTMLYYSDVAMTILVPDATAVGTGTYYIEGTSLGCTANGSVTVIVVTTPDIDPQTAIVACDSYALPVINGTALSGAQNYYDATGGPTVANIVTGPITSSTTLFVYDGVSGCSDEETLVITINPLPTVTLVSGGGTYCDGDAVSDILVDVEGTANFTVDYTLDGAALSTSGPTNPLSLGNAAGVYIITNITDGNACTNGANGSQTIVVNPIPSAPLAGTDSEYCSTVEPNLMTASGGSGTFTWYSDAGLTSVLGTGTTLDPSTSLGLTTYYVTETELGCEGPSSQVNISIIGCEITIPTAFTPDGDLMNDDWEILDLDLTYPNNIVYVYNRWGNLLFTSEQGSYDARRWDGTYKEELLPIGSYYFIIEFNDKENETATGIVSIILNK